MQRRPSPATTGLRDDDKELQVSAEIQPGNSGGPLLDRDSMASNEDVVIRDTLAQFRKAISAR